MMISLLVGLAALICLSFWRLVQQRRDCSLQANIIAATSCSVVVTDATVPHHPILFVNPSFQSLTGYAGKDVIGQTTALLTGPETERASIEKLALALQDGRACRVSLRHYRKNGSPFWNEVTLSPVRDRVGRLTSVIWVMSDVSHRREHDHAGHNERESPASLSDLASEGMLVATEGRIVYINRAGLKLLGALSAEQLIGKQSSDVVHPDFHGALGLRTIPTSTTGELGVWNHVQFVRLDGETVDVDVSGTTVSWKGQRAALFCFWDTSSQKQNAREMGQSDQQSISSHTEQRLWDSEKRFDLAVQAGQVGIFEFDHRTDSLYWSPILRGIYGVKADEPASLERYRELLHADDRDRIMAVVQRTHVPAGDGLFEAEHRILRPDGMIRHVHLRALTTGDDASDSPQALRTIGTVVDTTERKQAEAQQRHASKMEALGTFAGGIAHEFNNSLTAVLGFSELALPLIPVETKAYRHISQVIAAGRKSRELVHQLLTFSRHSDHVRCPVLLHALVKESLRLLRPTIPTWVELKEQIAKSACPILANSTQMHQMILNLIENALHAMRTTGGVLDVRIQNHEFATDQSIPGGRLQAGSYVSLIVRDTGQGMEPEIANRMFDPFFTTKAVGEGYGMGLSVVHGIVTTHGGTISVESHIDVGTTVSVYLPALPSRSSAVPDKEEPLPRGHECVLFVDDEDSLVRCGAEMLESLGYYPIVRKTAVEAWQAFQVAPQRFDLLITDQTMPGMSGDVLARKCQRLRPDLPVILCSGSDHMLSQEDGRFGSIAAFALKPLTLRELAHMVRRVLDRSTPDSAPMSSGFDYERSTESIEVS